MPAERHLLHNLLFRYCWSSLGYAYALKLRSRRSLSTQELAQSRCFVWWILVRYVPKISIEFDSRKYLSPSMTIVWWTTAYNAHPGIANVFYCKASHLHTHNVRTSLVLGGRCCGTFVYLDAFTTFVSRCTISIIYRTKISAGAFHGLAK